MTAQAGLKRTPLAPLHDRLDARMTPFAGYEMPVQYPMGVLKEHLHTRAAAGLFDVSHMGQVTLRPRSGDIADAARALERLAPVDFLSLPEGRQRYALFTDENGGILDDFMAANRGDHLFLVVNAACKEADIAHLRAHLEDACEVEELDDRALIAVQGPGAVTAVGMVGIDAREMRFMDVRRFHTDHGALVVSRSGYTGEDGFEISAPAERALALAEALLDVGGVEAIGLGARDSLRLEAGLCLYGADIDRTTTPVEAALEWAIQKVRRRGGERAGGFPGEEVILEQLHNGAPRRRVGLRPEGRAPMRSGTPLHVGEGGEADGRVTSGGFGPSVGAPVAMGYLPTGAAAPGTQISGEVRGRMMPAKVAALPFVNPGYKRS